MILISDFFGARSKHVPASNLVVGAQPEETPSMVQDTLLAHELKPWPPTAAPPQPRAHWSLAPQTSRKGYIRGHWV